VRELRGSDAGGAGRNEFVSAGGCSERNSTAADLEGDRPKRRSKEAHARIRELMGEAKIGAVLQFPVMRLRAGELAALEPGMVLRLPMPKHSASELRIGDCRFDGLIR